MATMAVEVKRGGSEGDKGVRKVEEVRGGEAEAVALPKNTE